MLLEWSINLVGEGKSLFDFCTKYFVVKTLLSVLNESYTNHGVNIRNMLTMIYSALVWGNTLNRILQKHTEDYFPFFWLIIHTSLPNPISPIESARGP